MFPVGGNLHSGVPQFTTNFGGANTMAQKVVGLIKLQIPAGKATPAPPVGPALGQHGVNIVAFTKDFNERTKNDIGLIIPVVITVYADRSFTFVTKLHRQQFFLRRLVALRVVLAYQTRQRLLRLLVSRSQRSQSRKCLTSTQVLLKQQSAWLQVLQEAWVLQ